MSSASNLIREKVLMQSLFDKDIDSFSLLFEEIMEEEYNSIVNSRFDELKRNYDV